MSRPYRPWEEDPLERRHECWDFYRKTVFVYELRYEIFAMLNVYQKNVLHVFWYVLCRYSAHLWVGGEIGVHTFVTLCSTLLFGANGKLRKRMYVARVHSKIKGSTKEIRTPRMANKIGQSS